MKLIYVKIPIVTEITRAYIVKDAEELEAKLELDGQYFKQTANWYTKADKDGKELKFHELSKDWG